MPAPYFALGGDLLVNPGLSNGLPIRGKPITAGFSWSEDWHLVAHWFPAEAPVIQPADFGPIDGTGRRVIDLTGLTSPDGFIIQGDAAGDDLGISVSSAGDVNSDGYDDLIIGAFGGDDGGNGAGEAYVIFGKASGFGTIDLTTLAAADGFIVQGDTGSNSAGQFVSSAGDVNGDGYDDVMVSAPGVAGGGRVYVIFGKSGVFGTPDVAGRQVLDLSGFGASDGFVVTGIGTGDISSAGDVNNDGFDDMILGAPDRGSEGEAIVLFGHTGPFTSINVATLSPAQGFVIAGATTSQNAGFSVSSAGDINGDGFADVVVGATLANVSGDSNSGQAYVIFGKAGGFGAPDGAGRNVISLTLLSTAEGFVIRGDSSGDFAGTSVSSAGDLDGDGFDDLIVGAPNGDDGGADAGEAYVIFGGAGGFGTPDASGRNVIDLTTLTWAQGFLIRGDTIDDRLGISVSRAGDVNNDGYDDLIVGANRGDDGGSEAGEAYVVFGSALGFGTSDQLGRNVIDLTTLGVAEGFIIQGDAAFDGAGGSVSAAGDVNNDGFDDLIVGARGGDDGGTSAGEAYVIFGRAFSTLGSPTPGNDRILGTAGNDTLDGLAGNDRIFGLAGNDTFVGDPGSDTMAGGEGDDTYFIESGLDAVIEAAGEGFDSVFAPSTYFLTAGAEVELLAAANQASTTGVELRGNAFDQEIRGTAGADTLDGLGGTDVLRGFGGNDLYRVDSADDVVDEIASGGFDIIHATSSYVLAAGVEIEVLIAQNVGPLDLTGNELSQQVFGNIRRNVLDGGGGADALYGGGGDDDFYVQSDDVIFQTGAGFDRVFTTTSYNLVGQSGSFEVLSAADTSSTAAIELTGTGSQQIVGNAGANTLRDGLSMTGLGGNDVYYVSSASAVVVEVAAAGFDIVYTSVDYTLAAGLSIEVLGSSTASSARTLIGNELGQQILGDIGNNHLDGGGGADALYGRGGDDTYIVQGDDVIVEAANAGFDIAYTSTSMTLTAGTAVEVLSVNDLAATTAINLAGNEFAQQIFGNAGANTLVSGGGQDGLYGGLGDDIYLIDGDDFLSEGANEGFDQAYSSTGITLGAGAHIEVLSVNDYNSTNALTIIGNELAQQIFGNAGANTLVGGGGQDALYGNGGDDIYLIDGDDHLVEGAGGGFDQAYSSNSIVLTAGASIEILGAADSGSTASLNFTGNAFGQQVFGNAGNNVLNGGGGSDALYGRGGADSFAFTASPGGGNFATLADFSAADDTILLDDAVFAALSAGALNPNAFVVGTAAQDADDRIIYNSATGQLLYDADGNGSGAAIHFATLTGAPAITASDFIVI